MLQIYKIVNRVDKLSPSKIFKFRNSVRNTKSARDRQNIIKEIARLDVRKNTFSQRVRAAWNRVEVKTKEKNFALFKSAIKKCPLTGGRPKDTK